MEQGVVIDMARGAIGQAVLLVAPVLLASLLIGLTVSVFQAVTQINEPTLTFVPKIIGVGLVLILLGPLMAANFLDFAAGLLIEMGRFTH